jgi:PAS domain-containing protein
LQLKATEPLPLFHSWALLERPRYFDLGSVPDWAPAAIIGLADEHALACYGIGRWECDLADDSLTWSDGVYDLFGLPRRAQVSRPETVALYCEESRAAMERLRAYAIQHKRGFTLDAQIRPNHGQRRWMRLIAAPICDGDRVVRLQGLKILI